ncbi:polysaccharide biosynthesis protein [Lacticaseibacillus songhuajiangensis]|jgi:PST family polysaccharide transporter|uniref:polysaccharide biosynthesis protein n=1 Tax=Lacticaseibacillus songhuajiangensis TaxID=1296539 RepID=UPI000F78B62D|nr:polysaccharide biosynthesis protein [Lacticaseibacillus songhuajiangensis]
MRNVQMKHLMTGAWILSLGGLISKILSAVYRVPFQNLVGDTGFYIYQQVYPLYGIGMVLALSGLPVYISKLIAAQPTASARRATARKSILLLTLLGGGIFALTMFGAPLIARAMADPQLTPLIRVVAVMFLLLPIVGGARAYFQGVGDMVPTASSQVVEQIVRVAIIIAAAAIGRVQHWSLYLIGTVAMSGAIVGGSVAALMLMRPLRSELSGRLLPTPDERPDRNFVRHFLMDGGALALFSALLVLMQLVDSFTITRTLTASGMAPHLAKIAKGVYDRGQPLVQLGLVVATALSQSMLPDLTRRHLQGRADSFKRTAVMMLHLSLISGVVAGCGLMVMMPAVNLFLFGDTQGSGVLVVYVLSVILVSALNAMSSLLQSQDQFRVPSIALGTTLLAKFLLTPILTNMAGTLGSAWATVLSLAIGLSLVYRALPLAIRLALWDNRFRRKLVNVATVMVVTGTTTLLFMPLTGRLHGLAACFVVGVVALTFGLVVAVRSGLLSLRELLMIPGGRQLAKLYLKVTNHRK